MNIAESTRFRELISRVDSLEAQLRDLHRRMDDQSKANRVIADTVEKSTLSLKRANG